MIDLSFTTFLGNLRSPVFLIVTLLVLAVVFVNGWTDSPNAIATCVSTRAMKPKLAVFLAAVFNFLGVLVMMMISSAVADTISKMVDFGKVPAGTSGNPLMVALCASLVSIVVWAVAAWYFGIPTSESHALIAGLTGSAIAMGGAEGINFSQWVKVLYGLGLSTVLGFGAGYLLVRPVEWLTKRASAVRGCTRRGTDQFFTRAQNLAAVFMAFMHGAQDGQKFIGVFVLGMFLAKGQQIPQGSTIPIQIWLILLVSLVMGVGTSIGGYRIIKAVGMDMVKLKKHQGFCADFAASVCLLLSTFTGIPVSTTHTKTTAMMGVGAAKRLRSVNWNVVKEMGTAWLLTFPGCGLIAFLMTMLFKTIFR